MFIRANAHISNYRAVQPCSVLVVLQQPAVKSKKSKKKKDKTRQIINLEVNFSDRKEETLMNENDAMIEGSGNASR